MKRNLVFLALTGLLLAPGAAQAQSETGSTAVTGPRAAVAQSRRQQTSEAGRYFVEFRSRYALSYGHSFLVHGRLDRRGQIGPLSAKNVAGFHPAGDGPEMWSAGHIVPVPAETGPSDGDLEEQYVSARFRVLLTEEEYRRVAAKIREMQAANTSWHAVLYNCNAWIGDIARYMGLQPPSSHLLMPADYVNEMKRLNTPGMTAEYSRAATPIEN